MSFGFYPRKNDACPNVGHCPHAGGVAIATLVQLSNDNEQFHRSLHGTIDAERKRNSRLFRENAKLKAELEQVKIELKLERQSKFATNKQKQAEAEASISPPAQPPTKKRGAPVGHPGWFRRTVTHYDWETDVPAPRRCPFCRDPVDVVPSADPTEHLQEDVIDGVYRVVLYKHAACRCGQCDRHVEQAGKNELPKRRDDKVIVPVISISTY